MGLRLSDLSTTIEHTFASRFLGVPSPPAGGLFIEASSKGGLVDACVAQLEAAIAGLESAAGDMPDAAAAAETLVPLERRVVAVRAGLSARAAAQGAHERSGHKDDAAWLARTTGVSKRQARVQLETQRRLEELPVLKQAQQKGTLSPAQVELAARAAEADPSQQSKLIGTAGREDLKGLKDECDRIIATADDDPGATYRRIKRCRSMRFWADHDGTHHLMASGTADDIGAIKSRVLKQADAWMRQANKAGEPEAYEAYCYDALHQLVTRAGDNDSDDESPEVIPPKRDLLFLVDLQAYRRGKALSGETCEIAGIGPVPVEVAAELDADPFIKAVIRDGKEIRTVVHYGRHVPAELRTALEARGVQCAAPGCSNGTHLEVDHSTVDYAKGGPLAIWNAQWLCPFHHRLKSQGLLDFDLPPPEPDQIE